MPNQNDLFDPITIRGMALRNRLVRSATAENMADDEGTPRESLARLYRRLGEGEVGLVITGHAFVRRDGKCHGEMTGIHEDRLIEPLSALAAAVHEGGGKIAVQSNHGGRGRRNRVARGPADAPSDVTPAEARAGRGGRVL